MAIDTPARHIYTGNGNQRVFPIPTKIIGDDYIRIEIDSVYQSDRTKWDIVNNSVIFITAPLNGTTIDIQVATSEEALSVLGSSTSMDIVAESITNVNTVATNIVDINQIVDNLPKILLTDDNATTATQQATIATNKASEASASANQALTSRNQAETFKNSASTSATTATTKASEASVSATSASTSASQALTSRNQAETFAQQAKASAKLVDSIAELKLISGSNDDKLEVFGYYTKGDGGGGTFYWDSTSTETDNGGTIIQATGVATGRWKRVYSGAVNVKWFGAKGDGATDDTQSIFNARKNSESIEYPSGNYNISSYQTSGTNVKDSAAKGNVNIKWNYPGAIAWLNFPSGTITKQLNFICTSSITGLRASIEDANNVVIERCHFEGFNDGNINDPSTDAWGLYLKNASSCTILNPTFANNGQSDLCMVDNVSNITVINPQSTSHSGICLNIEPNSLGINTNGAKNINFIGGKFLTVDIKEIENFCYANKDIFFTGSTIDTLNYKGASVSFSNCKITNIIPSSDSIYAGGLNIDNANLSKNILTDPYIFSVNSSGSYGWGTTASGGTYTRVQDGDGKYIRFNSDKLNITFQAFTRDYFPCVANETILIALRNRVDNTGSPNVHTENVIIQFYNSSNVPISTRSIRCARTLPNTNSGWRNDVALVTSPTNSTSFRLFIGKTVASGNTSSVDISAIGAYRITLNVPNGNFNKTLQELFKPVNEKTFYAPYSPLGGAGYFKGERVINSNPTVGQPKAWTCTVDGNPGTWVSEGNL